MEKTGNEAHKAQPNGLLWAYWEAHFKAFFFFSPRALPFVSTRKPRNQECKKSRTCDMDQEFHFDPFTGGDFDYPKGESFSGDASSGFSSSGGCPSSCDFDYPDGESFSGGASSGFSSSGGVQLRVRSHPGRGGESFSGGAASGELDYLGSSGCSSSGGDDLHGGFPSSCDEQREQLRVPGHPDRDGELFSGGAASSGFDHPGSCGRSSSAGEELHGHPYRDGYSFSGGAASNECHFLGRSGVPSSGDRYRCGEPFSGGYARGHGDLLGWSSCHSSCSQLLQGPATIVIVINDGAHAHGGGLAKAGQASSMSVPLVKSKQGTSLVPQLKFGPSAAPNLLHLLMEHILWDALEFSISWTTLRRHQPKLPTEWSWWMAMGSPFIQIDGICSIAASVMCVEAQHRLAFEILHGIGSFPLKAKRLKGVKKKCINKKVWSPAD
uniref:Uncharacterized protein n=1 Tax=Oryza meridionalis TaxID=40149 RepID=A0A0E0D9E0_9ORYZ